MMRATTSQKLFMCMILAGLGIILLLQFYSLTGDSEPAQELYSFEKGFEENSAERKTVQTGGCGSRIVTLEGMVKDCYGEPVYGASVKLFRCGTRSMTSQTVSSEDGSFDIPSMPSGLYDVEVIHRVWGQIEKRAVTLQEDSSLDVVFPGTASIEGRIVGLSVHHPMFHTRTINLYRVSRGTKLIVTRVPVLDGDRFFIPDVGPGEFLVEARTSSFRVESSATLQRNGETSHIILNFSECQRLPRCDTVLTGRAFREDRSMVLAGELISYTVLYPYGTRTHGRVRTDAIGWFEVKGWELLAGTEIFLRCEGFTPVRQEVTETQSSHECEIDVVFQSLKWNRVLSILAESGLEMPHTRVFFRRRGGKRSIRAETNSKGQIDLDLLPKGDYSVLVDMPNWFGYSGKQMHMENQFLVKANREEQISVTELTVQSGRSAVCRVCDEEGERVFDYGMLLQKNAGSRLNQNWLPLDSAGRARPLEANRTHPEILLTGLPTAGVWEVICFRRTKEGGFGRKTITWDDFHEAEVSIVVRRPVTITIKIEDEVGEGVVDAFAYCPVQSVKSAMWFMDAEEGRQIGWQPLIRHFTEGDGIYHLKTYAGLPGGLVILSPSAGGISLENPSQLSDGGTVTLSLGNVILGRVVIATTSDSREAESIPHVPVRMSFAGGKEVDAISDAQGRFVFFSGDDTPLGLDFRSRNHAPNRVDDPPIGVPFLVGLEESEHLVFPTFGEDR